MLDNACTKPESEFDKRARLAELPQARKLKTFYWDYYGKKSAADCKEWVDLNLGSDYQCVIKRDSATDNISNREEFDKDLDRAFKGKYATSRIYIKSVNVVVKDMNDKDIVWEWDCSFPTKGGHRVSVSFVCTSRFNNLGLLNHQFFT